MAPPTPALWAIERGDGAPAGWLFGTIHSLPAGIEWRTPALERALDDARMLVVEIRDLDPQRVAEITRRTARDEAVAPILERVDPGARPRLKAALSRAGQRLRDADQLETWAVAISLARTGTEPAATTSVDSALIADFASCPVLGLERTEEQLAIFDQLSERTQRRMLLAVMKEQETQSAIADATLRAWLAGDLARLDGMSRRGMLSDPVIADALNAERNRAWVAMIEPLLRQGKAPLIAVGTLHMIGPEGLPALLATKGYRVRRIQ